MAGKLTDDRQMSASRLPALMGYSKYSTPNDELQYSIRAIGGLERPFVENSAMFFGTLLEPIVIEQACKRLSISKFDSNIRQAIVHESLPLQCSLDGLAEGEGQTIVSDPANGIYVMNEKGVIVLRGTGVIEAKTTKAFPETGSDLSLARGPIQLQGQLLCTGHQWGAVAVLYSGQELRIFLFEAHYETQKQIVKQVIQFQSKLDKYIATGELDWYEPTTSAEVNQFFPIAHKEQIELDGKAIELAQTILDKKLVIAACESTIDDAEKSLKQMLGDNEKAIAGSMIISWPMRYYKESPEKLRPAKKAYSIRQTNISIKETTT
jgi:predicted phage-related endonuclease